MTKTRKWLSLLMVLTLVGIVAAGCSGGSKQEGSASTDKPKEAATGEPVDGGSVVVGTFSDIVTTNPLFVQDTSSGDAEYFLFAKLYEYDRKGNVTAPATALASEPPVASADGKEYTIKLKNGLKWSDGKPITAEDVIFTIDAVRNPKVGSPGISGYDKVSKAEKVDDQTIKVTMKQVYAPFPNALVQSIIPAHILKDVKPEELQANAYGTDPAKTVTSGPWKWSEWKQKQYLTFDENPNYWGKKPHIKKITYKIYADQNTEVQALIKGDIDILSGIPVTQVEAVKKRDSISVISEPGPVYEYLAFNFNSKNFNDNYVLFTGEKTRQALAYAINRQGMVDNVLKGTGKALNAPFLPGSWADPGDAAVNYNFDPEKAKQLLAEDGWVAGADGILAKDGHKFSFELQYNAGNSRRQQVATIIQQNLKDIGVEVLPKAIDFSSWVDQNVNKGKFQAILLSWSLNNPDPDGENIFSSKYYPPAGQNIGWYKNEKLDELWVKGYSTVDQAERKKIYEEAGKEISTNLPYVFMYQYGTPEALGPKVKFKEEDKPELSLAYGYFYNIQNWWVEEK